MIFGRRRDGRGGGIGGRVIIGVVVALIGVMGYFAKDKVFNPETGESYRVALSVDEEKALGLQAAKQMIPQMGGAIDPAKDPQAALVEQIGRKLVANSGAGKGDYADNYNFYLINDPKTINAFALPGGQVSITKGLLDQLENEAQVAGVIGHEIGHVVAQHSAQQMAKGQLGQAIATGVAVGASGEDGAGRYAGMAAMMANQMVQLKYGREDEAQSDNIGLKYMMESGYDPRAMLDVMKVLEKAGGGGKQPEFMSSHPHPQTRYATIEKFLSENKDQIAKRQLTMGRSLRALEGGSSPNRQLER